MNALGRRPPADQEDCGRDCYEAEKAMPTQDEGRERCEIGADNDFNHMECLRPERLTRRGASSLLIREISSYETVNSAHFRGAWAVHLKGIRVTACVERVSMREQLEDFLHYMTVERGVSNNTIVAYRNDLKQLTEYLEAQNSGGFRPLHLV